MSSFQLIVINEPDLQPKWPSRLQELSGQDRSQSKHPGRVEILQTNLRTAETERTCCNGKKSVGMPAIHNKYKRITDPKVRDPIGSLDQRCRDPASEILFLEWIVLSRSQTKNYYD